MGSILSLLVLSFGLPGLVQAQEVWAKVVDATNDRPIQDAEVQILYSWGELVTAALTDRDGRVFLKVPPGGYRIAVDRLGYPATDTLGIHLAPGQNLTVQLKLQPEAIELEGLTVLVEEIDWHLEMAGFYNRQRGASGFLDPTRDPGTAAPVLGLRGPGTPDPVPVGFRSGSRTGGRGA
jgi:hypothetical protein